MQPRSGFTKVSFFISVFLVTVLFVVFPSGLHAANLNDLLNQKNQLERENKALQSDAGESKQEITSLQSAVAFLDRSIATLQNDIAGTERQISETSAAIAEKERELATKKSEKDEGIRVMYELQAADSVVESLLGNEDLSEATNRVEYIDAMEQRLGEVVAALHDIRSQLEAKRGELESLKGQQTDQKRDLEARQTQKERLLANEQVELSKINRQLDANRKKLDNIEAQIAAQVAALWRKGFTPGTGVRVAKGTPIGRLGSTGYSTGPHVHFECLKNGSPVNPRSCVPPYSWPLTSFSVSQEYGRPNWNAAYSFHTGIDLVAPYGAPVLAACSGEIIMRQWYGGYGNAVVIACDNGWWTLYGHMIN